MINYEINQGTLAIVPLKNGRCKIIEDDCEYLFNCTTFEILDHSCKYFGSSYNGRREGSKDLLGYNYKIPIIVEEINNLIFFPTAGADENDCMWIAVNKIKYYRKEKYNTSKITFYNEKTLNVPLSYRALQNQILRSIRLCYLLEHHKEKNVKNS